MIAISKPDDLRGSAALGDRHGRQNAEPSAVGCMPTKFGGDIPGLLVYALSKAFVMKPNEREGGYGVWCQDWRDATRCVA